MTNLLPLLLPIATCAFPILFLYAHNVSEMLPVDLQIPLAASAGITVVCFLLLWAIFRDRFKASLGCSAFLILFFSFGHILNMISTRGFFRKIPHLEYTAIAVFTLTWLLILTILMFQKRNMASLVKSASVLAFAFILIPCIQLTSYYFGQKKLSVIPTSSNATITAGAKPDIYYIMVDGYANTATMQDIFNYDNKPFEKFLEAQGFYVPKRTCGNYNSTKFCLASTLNMDYLDKVIPGKRPESTDHAQVIYAIQHNEVAKFLKSQGYEYIHFASGWGGTDPAPLADKIIQGGNLNEFMTLVLHTTAVRPFLQSTAIRQDESQRILRIFDKTGLIDAVGKPKFVFAHIVCPHPPWLFYRDGSLMPPDDSYTKFQALWFKDPYFEQFLFTTNKLKELVPKLVNRPRPTIVIIQSDHGTTVTSSGIKDWDAPNNRLMQERLRNFTAIYSKGVKLTSFYDTMTSVNTFRLLFNDVFGTKFAHLKDKSYWSGYKLPYGFTDVIEIARPPVRSEVQTAGKGSANPL